MINKFKMDYKDFLETSSLCSASRQNRAVAKASYGQYSKWEMLTPSLRIPNSYVGIWKAHKKRILTKSGKKDTWPVANKFMVADTKQTNQMSGLETILSAIFSYLNHV